MEPSIKPLGVGDLILVKQKLARYEAGEVAHIENVMASESRGRKHRRLRQVEETVTREEEREEESRRDLQSTERFELETETKETVKSETTLEAGLEVSGSYGPVKVTAYGNYASSSSREESERNAKKYAKDVTDRTVSRLKERVRQERVTRTLEEVEEKNRHGFDNSDGDEHITGIYRWVDKYYRSKLVNYGRRLMYEFVVPEPGAFFLFSEKYTLENDVLPERPERPTLPGTTIPLSPGDLTRFNYLTLVREYDVEGVKPPPPEQLVVSKAISRELQADHHWAFANEDFSVPDGYEASFGGYAVSYTWKGDGEKSGTLKIGLNSINVGDYPGIDFNGERGFIPLSGTGYGLRSFAINMIAICDLLPEAFKKWQLETYSAIMNAYHKQRMDYEERLAAAEIQEGVSISGRNPEINRQIEQEQLKKACLALWTGEPVDLPPGIEHHPDLPVPFNYPQFDVSSAIDNGKRIDFLEGAFEWENMTYEFFPFYWGRREKWLDTLSVESDDPMFEKFLRAGAAKVRVPVRPTRTEAVLYYQMTGVAWSGGDVPALSDVDDPDAELYASYLDELENVEDLPDVTEDVEIAADDPDTWLAKVPTTLVWLQGDEELPDFEAA